MYLSVSLCCIAEVLIEASIITVYICDIPLVDIGSILEVKEDLRALTEIEGCSCNEACIMNERCCECACEICRSISLAYRCELKTVESTQLIVCDLKYNVAVLDNNLVKTAVDRCLDTDSDLLIEGNGHNSLRECKSCGDNDICGAFTYYLSVIYQLCCYSSCLTA